MRHRECLNISINKKVEVNFMKFIKRASFIARFELLILRYGNRLSKNDEKMLNLH